MLSKITLAVLLGLAALKLLGKPRLKGLFKEFDRFINTLLVAIVIAYGVQLLWIFFGPT